MKLELKVLPCGDLTVYEKLDPQQLQAASERAKAYWAKLKAKQAPQWGQPQEGDIDAVTGWRIGADGEAVAPEDDSILMGLSSHLNLRHGTELDTFSGGQPENLPFPLESRVSGSDPYDRCFNLVGTVVEVRQDAADPIGVKWDVQDGEDRPTFTRWYKPEALRPHLYVVPESTFSLPVQSSEQQATPPAPAPMSGFIASEASNSDDCNHLSNSNNFNDDSVKDCGAGFSKQLPIGQRKGRYPQYSRKIGNHIQSALILMEQDIYCKSMLALVTCTFPDMEPEDESSINQNIAGVIKLLRDGLRKELKKVSRELGLAEDIPLEDVGVIEICPKAAERGKAKPHLHFVLRNKVCPSGRWLITTDVMDRLWQNVIDNFTSKKYVAKCNKMEKVKKSVAHYLSKYLSKGSHEDLEKLKLLGIQLPVIHSRYFMARSITQYLANWIECHKRTTDYYKGIIQLEQDLKNPLYRSKVKGMKDENPIMVTRIDKYGEEVPVALKVFFDSRYRDAFADWLVEQMSHWDRRNRDSQYHWADAQSA